MINPLTSSLPKQGYWVLFSPENIILDNIMQNLLNLRMYYAWRFLRLSLLLISSYTVHLFGKLVKRKFSEKTPQSDFGGPSNQKLNISCQIKLLKNNKEMSPFDLQTVGFWVSKNIPSIGRLRLPKKESSALFPSATMLSV